MQKGSFASLVYSSKQSLLQRLRDIVNCRRLITVGTAGAIGRGIA
jgi:hypothetical protein